MRGEVPNLCKNCPHNNRVSRRGKASYFFYSLRFFFPFFLLTVFSPFSLFFSLFSFLSFLFSFVSLTKQTYTLSHPCVDASSATRCDSGDHAYVTN